METEERWKSVVGYEGCYEVSNMGRIRSIKRTTTRGGMMHPHTNKRNGYVYVMLTKDGKYKNARLHRIVMSAFNPTERTDLQINHIDGDKTNNAVSNLEWCTAKENIIHAYKTGLTHHMTRPVIDLTTGTVYNSMTEAAATLDGMPPAIYKVCTGERSHYKNHCFAFLEDYKCGNLPAFKGKYRKRSSESLWGKRPGIKALGAN